MVNSQMRIRLADADASSVPGMSAADVSDMFAVDTGDETMVQQSFKDEVDVNTILRRFGAGLPMWRVGSPQGFYADFREVHDYDSAVRKVQVVHDEFMKLPADMREKFGNDPGKLVDAVSGMTQEEFEAMMKPITVPEVVPPPPTE